MGASQWFTDAGIGYRGGYGDGGFGGGIGGFLLAMLLARGGFTDHHGCHHKCDDLGSAQAILDRMSVNERQQMAHDIKDSLGERVKDTRDDLSGSLRDAKDCLNERISDVKTCVNERISDKTDCLKEKLDCIKDEVKDVKLNQHMFEREFCDFKAVTGANFERVLGEIKTQSYETRLREADAREQAQRDEVEKLRFARLRDEIRDEQRCGNECNRREFEAIVNSFNRQSGIGNGGIGSGNASGNTVIELAQTIAAAKSFAVGPTAAV